MPETLKKPVFFHCLTLFKMLFFCVGCQLWIFKWRALCR